MKKSARILFFSVMVLMLSSFALAQSASLYGRAQLLQTDGSTIPLGNAVVEVYRTDIGTKMPPAKTNTKGIFALLGLPPGGTFKVCVNAPNVKAICRENVKAGSETLVFTLVSGDNSQPSNQENNQTVKSQVQSQNSQTSTDDTKTKSQFGEIAGKVQLIETDGKILPVANARVYFMRPTDTGNYGGRVTNANGYFSHSLTHLETNYVVCVTASNIRPTCFPNIKAGMTNLVLTANKGIGKPNLFGDELKKLVKALVPKINTDGFIDIKYGSSLKVAKQIVSELKLGEINEKKSNSQLLVLDFSNTDCTSTESICGLGDFDKSFRGLVELQFYDDKFYNALIVYPTTDENRIEQFKRLVNRLGDYYYISQIKVERGDIDKASVEWRFRQPEGGDNIVNLSTDDSTETVSIGLVSEVIYSEIKQKYESKKAAEEIVDKAYKSYQEKKYELAITEFTNALKLNPDSVKAYHYRGHSFFALGKYDLAVADFTSALKFESENTHYLNDRATAYATWSANKFELALADLAKAIKIKPNDARPYLLRARIFCHQGKKVLAAADEKDAISLGGQVTEKCQ